MSAEGKPAKRDEQQKEEELAIEEIKQKFYGDWVAIRVTQRDESGQPLKGVVLAHDVNRTLLRNMLNDVAECCIFSTKPPMPVMF
ncbi:MAG: hypothetical protein M1368_06130 [Thaumarchaeota archaeon]|nr:hypothetical protein [Nitrososphaerota archaeon]